MHDYESEERFLNDYRIREEYQEAYESFVDSRGREEQRRIVREIPKEWHNVQAFVNNIAAPKSLEQLQFYIHDHGCFNVEDILVETETSWTVPGWAKPGDIVFFMHSKTARTSLTALRSALKANAAMYKKSEYNLMLQWVERGLLLHSQYGGKIYAIGRVAGKLEHEDISNLPVHWHSRNFADIDGVTVLSNPIDISLFRQFLQISRVSGITPVFGTEYRKLKDIICRYNEVPMYFRQSDATPMPLAKINKENWMKLTAEFRHAFFLECQFRTYFVDYLLHALSDRATIFKECRCVKQGIPASFVDNIIWFNGKLLPVQVKLSVSAQANIVGQVSKYCEDDSVFLTDERQANLRQMYTQNVLIIDTDTVFMYNHRNQNYAPIYDLNHLLNHADIAQLKKVIAKAI